MFNIIFEVWWRLLAFCCIVAAVDTIIQGVVDGVSTIFQ